MDFESLQEALIEGDEDALLEEIDELLDEGANPVEIITVGMMGAMETVGDLFSKNQMFVPEVLMCADAMKLGIEKLKPLMEGEEIATKGKIAIGTVKGDLHDIGKNLVAMLMEVNGFEVINLGVDVAPEEYLDAVINQGAQIVAMSALLTTTMSVMKEVIEVLKANNLRDKVKVIVGGAPVSKEYAEKIGADGYSKDAGGAVELCRKYLT